MVTEEQIKECESKGVVLLSVKGAALLARKRWMTTYIYIYLAHACALHILEVALKDAHSGTLQEPNRKGCYNYKAKSIGGHTMT